MPAIYCGDHTALALTVFGNKIYVDTRDTSLAPHIMMEGNWEPWVTSAIGTVLRKYPGCTFIDVGANVGWYTLLACKVRASHVFAFEPNPRMVELLRKTITVNGYGSRVTLTEAACGGAEQGIMGLAVNPQEAGGAHLVPRHYRHDVHECAVVRLDDIVLGGLTAEAADLPKIIMKVDVEGYEPEVLRGAKELLTLNPIMFLEHNQQDAHRGMYLDLRGAGFELRHAQYSGFPGETLTVDEAMLLSDAETVIAALPGQL